MFPYPISFNTAAAAGLADIDNVYSMEFDGVDDYGSCGIIPALNSGGGALTISLWAKHVNINGNDNIYVLCATGSTYRTGLWNFNGDILFNLANGSNDYATCPFGTADGFSNGVWYNIVGVFDGTEIGNANRAKIYIDGVQQTCTFGGTIPTNVMSGAPYSSESTYIATNVTAYSSYLFEGNIDEVSIFDIALNASDVESIFNATSTGKTADLSDLSTPPIAWYRMGD